jgi:organic radical activating enzyme
LTQDPLPQIPAPGLPKIVAVRFPMRTVPVEMLDTVVNCRGYWCSTCKGEEGKDLSTPQFILYLMATKKCNGGCLFCDIQRYFLNLPEPNPDLGKLAKILTDLYGRNVISKISITGGEPLLDHRRTNKLLKTIFSVKPDAKVDVTVNGSLLGKLDLLDHADKLATIHVSRHHFDQEMNDRVFGLKTATLDELRVYAEKFPDKISLNCCLVPGNIDSANLVERYIDWAATIKGLKSAGFISLMNKNEFCETNVVKEKEILDWIDQNPYNFRHDYLYDTDICECRVFQRVPSNYRPMTVFWWKVSRLCLPYCRQLMFTADNRLTVNFNEIAEIEV